MLGKDNFLTYQILQQAYKVHSALGPGLLESAYRKCLVYELIQNGYHVEEEKMLPLIYKEVKLEFGYRIDIMVENRIVLELKTVEEFTDVHIAQLITYLKLTDSRTGLLLNFHTSSLKDGIKRISL